MAEKNITEKEAEEERKELIDAQTKGVILGSISSIFTSLVTLYIAQHYLIQKAATEAAKTAIKDYKQEFGIMSSYSLKDWEPLTQQQLNHIKGY